MLPPYIFKRRKMAITTKICPGDETAKVELWNGKWKIVNGETVPDLRLMPVGKTITGTAGVGHWFLKGYKLPEDIPTNDDGSYRVPPGVLAEMQNEQKDLNKFIKDQLNQKKEPDPQNETLDKIVSVLSLLVTRIENLENAKPKPAKNKPNSKRVQKRVSSKKTKPNKRGDGKDKKTSGNCGKKRGPSCGERGDDN